MGFWSATAIEFGSAGTDTDPAEMWVESERWGVEEILLNTGVVDNYDSANVWNCWSTVSMIEALLQTEPAG